MTITITIVNCVLMNIGVHVVFFSYDLGKVNIS